MWNDYGDIYRDLHRAISEIALTSWVSGFFYLSIDNVSVYKEMNRLIIIKHLMTVSFVEQTRKSLL